MNTKAISEIMEISSDLLYVQHRIIGISQLLITAGHADRPPEETGIIGIGHCLDDIAQKLHDGSGNGIGDRLGKVEKMLQRQTGRKAWEGIEPEEKQAVQNPDPRGDALLDCINKLDVLHQLADARAEQKDGEWRGIDTLVQDAINDLCDILDTLEVGNAEEKKAAA